jgi:hypothetical protein
MALRYGSQGLFVADLPSVSMRINRLTSTKELTLQVDTGDVRRRF